MTPLLIREEAALRRLEPAWWALWRRVPDASPFMSPAWLLSWWAAFAPGSLLTVAVLAEERLLALAPLWLEEGPYGRRLLPLGLGLSDEADLLLDPGAPEAAAALLETLAGTAAGWDRWSAEELPPGAALLDCPMPSGWRAETVLQSACPVLPLGEGAAEAAVPAAKRRKWRMARHRSARRGSAVERIDAAGLEGALGHLERLHALRWEEKGEAGVLADGRVRRFHRSAAPRLMEAGLLRLRLLRLGDEVAGVYYGLQAGRRAMAYLGGFDPRFAFESPGTVLLGAALEEAAAEGAASFSFLRGREPYKYEWGATDRWNSRRTIEPPR